ncbi:MAG: hypothetical protein CAPSK01_003926 [Candidatus Accumulibacter vicinus]|uniref:Uncharacterized protein n=1 Tax=Candidatus Accumulibacter vicinus TaxID=2954382 RepID=A0A084XWZ1_9PROT|nr:MAG: hypothetical protein CAPSK01_003926 [Candidatus Accumulibacter vicinus]
MVQRVPERFGGLPRESPSRGVGDRPGNHHRPAATDLIEVSFNGKQRRLGVQGVEDGLDQQEVGAAIAESADGFGVGADQFVEAGVPVAGVIDIRRDRSGARGRPDDAGDKAGPGRVPGSEFVAHRPRQLRAGHVQLIYDGFEMVIGLRDAGRVEGVGLDDVGAGGQILGMDRTDDLWSSQQQQVVVTLEIVRMRREATATIIRLLQALALDHRSHCTVENQNVLFEEGFQFVGTVSLHGWHG